MASSPLDGHQPHFAVTADLGSLLPPIPEHECFTGHGELQLVALHHHAASSRASSSSGSGGHLSLLSSSLGPLGHDEDDDEDVEAAAAAAAASFPPMRGAGNSNLFENGCGGSNESCSMSESLSRASHHDLAFEWSMLCQECTECWTGTGKLTTCTKSGLDKRTRNFETGALLIRRVDPELGVKSCF